MASPQPLAMHGLIHWLTENLTMLPCSAGQARSGLSEHAYGILPISAAARITAGWAVYLCLGAVGNAHAAPIIYTFNGASRSLVSFDASAPETALSSTLLTGLANSESVVAMDFRPATGQLYAVIDNGAQDRVVTIDISTGAVTTVGSVLSLPTSGFVGMDFDPVADTIRLVDWNARNIRISPVTGALLGSDTNLAYVAGDPGSGSSPEIVHIAYDRSIAGANASTLYGVDFRTDIVVRIGGIDGAPSADGGALTTIGPMGVSAFSPNGGFDIDPATGAAYAVVPIGSSYRLYRVNLSSGAATLLGALNGGTSTMAIAPDPPLFGDGFE